MTGVRRQRPSTAPQLQTKVEPLNVGSPVLPEPRTTVVPDAGSTGVREDRTTGLPKYLTMRRMDARLRPDQISALADLRERVARNRADRSERISESTLVRIAVDLLLARSDRLTGDTETALRESVSTVLREYS